MKIIKEWNVTQNRTSIISLPFEGELQQIEEEFEGLPINYSVLPNLHVGDGQIRKANENMKVRKKEI